MRSQKSYFVLGHRVTPLDTMGDFGMVEIISYPEVPGPPPHHHDDTAEFFYIAEGRLDVCVDGSWRTLETGEFLSIPGGTVHTLMNRSSAPCRWITGWSPRGFEVFFERYGVEAADPDAMERSTSEEIVRRVVAECGDLGMILAKE